MPIGFHELLEKNLSGMDRVKQFLCAIILVKARLKMRIQSYGRNSLNGLKTFKPGRRKCLSLPVTMVRL